MGPIAFSIGSLEIRWYSLLIVIALLIAYIFVMLETKKFNINQNFVVNVIFWAVILGIIGARAYYVIFNFDYYKDNIVDIFKIWNGGLAIHGGIIAGSITTFLYCRKYKFNFLKMLDVFAPFMILAQAIGRWGNFFNEEAYGAVTTYAKLKELHVPNFIIDGMYINGNYYLPMFFFESLWCLLGFVILLIIRRFKKIRIGQITSIYLMWYSFGRFFIEKYRMDSLLIGSYKMAQLVSICLFIVGLVLFIVKSLKKEEKDMYNYNKVKEN